MKNLSIEKFKVSAAKIDLTEIDNQKNVLGADCRECKPNEIPEDEFNGAVWSAIRKAVKELHQRTYAKATADEFVANAVYDVKYNGETKKVINSLLAVLSGDEKLQYNNQALMLQEATTKFINAELTDAKKRATAHAKLEKNYKAIMQWAFDFLTSDRVDGVKVYANNKDVDMISGLLLRQRNEKISTTGERTIQAYIEFAFRQKILDKPYYVELYSVIKEQNGVINTVEDTANANEDEESNAEENSAE